MIHTVRGWKVEGVEVMQPHICSGIPFLKVLKNWEAAKGKGEQEVNFRNSKLIQKKRKKIFSFFLVIYGPGITIFKHLQRYK